MKERGKKPASRPSPYSASAQSSPYNPYASRAQESVNNDAGFDAPAPSTFDAEPGYFAGGAKPIVPATTMGGAYQPQPFYTPAGPVNPVNGQAVPAYGQGAYQPQQQPASYAPPAAPAQPQQSAPAAPAEPKQDDLGVPAYLRRGQK